MINDRVQTLIDAGHPIRVTSGEGEVGHVDPYTGTRTVRAIKRQLSRERAGGDRWARASVYSHQSAVDGGDVWIDVETGDYY